jgi:serine beta-lactamase-like protein LACTB
MLKKLTENWLGLGILGIGLLVAGFAGLWVYVNTTATPLHPNARDVQTVTGATPQAQWEDAVEGAREIVRSSLAAQNLPGLSVAVGIGDEILWAEGFGWADLEKRVAVAPETTFRLGTASMALTSAAAGLLVEKDTLKLDEPIQTYVPAFPDKQWPVTLRQLLAHTAGVRNDSGDEGPLLSQQCERPLEALQYFADSSLLFEPGTQFRFSSYGGIVVSAAIEAAAGEPFLTFMQEQVFEPLRMDDTRADAATGQVLGRATFYFPRFAADPRYGLHLMREVDYSCYAGAGVFLSTPSDMVRFAMALSSGKLLQPATVRLLQAPQRLPSGEETGYGLGWDIETATLAGTSTRVVGHDGALLGGNAVSLMTFPEHGIVVAVMSNMSYADTAGVGAKIAEAFVNGAPEKVEKR